MKHAFSLIELSIVLVILGLLTGGILTGQSLIRAAELRSVTTEFSQYQTAVMIFRNKYFALPGDMRNATDFWGSRDAGGSGSGCWSLDAIDNATCNGDGNGQVAEARREPFTFWQHLANAGLIKGNYSGKEGPDDGDHAVIGVNVPASKVSPGGWYFRWGNVGVITAHHMRIGAEDSADSLNEVLFTPEEAWGIDTKIDDGRPRAGKVFGMQTDCATGTTATDEYQLNLDSVECVMDFLYLN